MAACCHGRTLAQQAALALGTCLVATAAACSGEPLLPAYAHNDYLNDRPLVDALALGYRGVEADVFLVDGELRVAHERDETAPGRTLAALYLEPLRALVDVHGTVLADSSVFLLNIEAKEPGRATYDALRAELARFAGILTVVRDGVEEPGAVQVVLVGWHPPLAELAVESPRYAAVQCRYRDLPADHEDLPAHLLKMISVPYGDEFEWLGSDGAPPEFRCRLQAIRDRAGAVPGRILRVFQVPQRSRIYLELLAGGIDLVGSRNLERDRRLLAKVRERVPGGNTR